MCFYLLEWFIFGDFCQNYAATWIVKLAHPLFDMDVIVNLFLSSRVVSSEEHMDESMLTLDCE